MSGTVQTWEVWYPDAAATGLLIGRGKLQPTMILWLHSAPPNLAVIVRDGNDRIVARSDSLMREGESFPMTRLEIIGEGFVREDRFPTKDDLGCPVLLPGGEVGLLCSWWNASDGSEWRWEIEFHNRR